MDSHAERIAKTAMFWALWILAAWAITANALEVEPKAIVFTEIGQSHTIKVTDNGQPVPADQISYRAMIGEHDYNEMFDFKKANGQITVGSIDFTQIGSYDLVVSTGSASANVEVYTPLSEEDNVLEKMAKANNISVDEVRLRLGMSEDMRSRITLTVPTVYYEGEPLTLTVPQSAAGRTQVWTVNGTEVARGSNTVSLVFKGTGPYAVMYKEMEGDRVVASTHAVTQVVSYPPIPWTVPAGVDLNFPTLPGYGEYTWTLDGNPIEPPSTTRKYALTPGKHTLVLVARDSNTGHPDAFKRLTYSITATQN